MQICTHGCKFSLQVQLDIQLYVRVHDLLSLGFCALHVAFLSMLSHTLCVSECIDIYGI